MEILVVSTLEMGEKMKGVLGLLTVVTEGKEEGLLVEEMGVSLMVEDMGVSLMVVVVVEESLLAVVMEGKEEGLLVEEMGVSLLVVVVVEESLLVVTEQICRLLRASGHTNNS